MKIENRGRVGLPELQQVVREMVDAANGQSRLAHVQSTFRAGVPQIYVDIDRVKAKSLGVPLDSIFNTMQAALGSAYVNDFDKFGKTYQVRVQADEKFRLQPEDFARLEVRKQTGQMIPLGSLSKTRRTLGPQIVPRYNLYPSATINGSAAQRISSGQALLLMEQLASSKLPQSMGYKWTAMSFQEKHVGSQAFCVFALGVLMVYLVLAGQYESGLMPAAVIMAVPLALLAVLQVQFPLATRLATKRSLKRQR